MMHGYVVQRWMTVQSIEQHIYIHLKTILYPLRDNNDDVIRCYFHYFLTAPKGLIIRVTHQSVFMVLLVLIMIDSLTLLFSCWALYWPPPTWWYVLFQQHESRYGFRFQLLCKRFRFFLFYSIHAIFIINKHIYIYITSVGLVFNSHHRLLPVFLDVKATSSL